MAVKYSLFFSLQVKTELTAKSLSHVCDINKVKAVILIV